MGLLISEYISSPPLTSTTRGLHVVFTHRTRYLLENSRPLCSSLSLVGEQVEE